MRINRALIAAGLVAGVAAAAPAAASAAPGPFYLDSYAPHNQYAGPAYGTELADGGVYIAKVAGTISYYSAATWVNPTAPFDAICGNPYQHPDFKSPDNSPKRPLVGMDAEVVFARPCVGATQSPAVGHWSNFEVNTDSYYRHPETLFGSLNQPTANNTYEYALFGHGKVARFRLRDLPGAGDNYGRLKITVKLAVAADCKNGRYAGLGFASEDACKAGLKNNPPASVAT